MKLDVGGWRTIQDPSAAQIRDAIRELDDTEGFLVFSKDDYTYIQSSGDSRIGFDLEFQEGGIDRHYRATKTDFDAGTIVSHFLGYAAGDEGWKNGVEWEKLTL